MKKRIAVLFGTALLAGMMTACGGDTAETTAAATTAAETAAETEAAAEETEAAAEETEAAAEIVAPAEDVAMQYVSAEDAAGLLNTEGTTIFDVRKAEDYAAGHIPGAINIDVLQPDFESNCIKRLSKDHTIAVYCRSGKRSKKAAQILSKQHFQVIELNDGFLGWTQKSKPVSLE